MADTPNFSGSYSPTGQTLYQYVDASGTLQTTPDPTTATTVNGSFAVVDASNNVVLSGSAAGSTYNPSTGTSAGTGGTILHAPTSQIIADQTSSSAPTGSASTQTTAAGGSYLPILLLAALVGAALLL